MRAWLVGTAIAALGCGAGSIETPVLPVTIAQPLMDGGVLLGSGCGGTSKNRVIMFFDATEGPLFCIAIVLRRAPGPALFEFQPPAGWSVVEARASPLCEMELASGSLDTTRSVPVDGAWGTTTFDFEVLGIPRQYSVSSETAFRVGRSLFTVEPSFYGLWGDCVVQ